MKEGLTTVVSLRERYERVCVQDKGSVYNQDLVQTLQLGYLLDVAWLCAEGALRRQESRGGHFRTDYPKLDNERFLQHTYCRRRGDGSLDLSYGPVTIQDIEPQAEVKY